jgi:hypothetical membrane protein
LVAEALQPPGYDPVRMTISALARHGAAHRWIMTAGLFAIGGCHLVTAAGLRGLRRRSRLVLAAGGIAGIGIALCAQPDHGSTDSHLAFTVLGLILLAIWPITAVTRTGRRFPLRPRDAVFSAVLSVLLFGWLVEAIGGTTLGLAERALTTQQELWPLLVVLALRRSSRWCAEPSAGGPRTAPDRGGSAERMTG